MAHLELDFLDFLEVLDLSFLQNFQINQNIQSLPNFQNFHPRLTISHWQSAISRRHAAFIVCYMDKFSILQKNINQTT